MRTAVLRSILRCSGTALFLMAGVPAVAGQEDSAAGRSPFLGTWELDLSRMPANYGPPPRRVLYTFEDAGDGHWRTTVDITAPDGSIRHMAVRYARDGSASAGEGDQSEADSAAINQPAPNVLVMSLSKNKMLGSVRVYAISSDGKEMTESAAAADSGGTPFVRNFHFRRVR
ncbi:hypothetical protein [uncultured Sphingomonas sp.]|uniref:hypothetical protein n=1 Tax=uncultured Sphingomonas sp. TaxID=158754 RepID=UPI0025FA13EE|nr:hypothetical protein [uncultured Sphingomonas sp.]